MSRHNPFYRDLMLKLDRSSTQVVFVENYEIKLFRSDYTHIPKYLCRVSFHTTLDIYKNYFKGRHTCIVWSNAKSGLVHYSLYISYCIFVPKVLWLRSFLIFIVDELKNFAANIFFKLVELVTYWDSCIERRDCRYNTSPIRYWGKGSTVSWYFGIGQRVW